MKISDLNILVVEDDDFQRRMMVKALHTLGAVAVRDASNGRHALEIVRKADGSPVDVALCDLNMPEMDGMQFLRHLSEDEHGISIVITSALDSKLLASVARMARLYGIRLLGVLEKPILPETIRELLANFERTAHPQERTATGQKFGLEEILDGIHSGQFEPFLQPKVNLVSGELVGAEALARWRHPQHGLVSPYAFVPLLEKSGNIDALTFLMLQRCAAASKMLRNKNSKVSISVNLSLLSLEDAALADTITRIVQGVGADPRNIVLEITETAAMTDTAHALENLARLSMNGFALSIDDYGTGYANLQQLTRIAFSELKIDQSFVRDCANDSDLRIVVESSIDMARKLNVRTVAEGVEKRSDLNLLKGMGCDMAQGYYIAKPMDLDSFVQYCVTG